MGEAKRKRRKHASIIENAPGCIYCAASRPAEQIDHMPPRAMFRLSQRPRGLEFPSCAICNQGTSRLDVIATLTARTFPGIATKDDAREWDKVTAEAERVAPGIMREMVMPRPAMERTMRAYGVSDPEQAMFWAAGPILSAHMQAFAATTGFALHYEATGTIVPSNGRVQVRWFTSKEVENRKLSDSLIRSLDTRQPIRQGRITSDGLFEYGHVPYAGKPDVPLYFAKVREAFLAVAFVADEVGELPFSPLNLATFAPGDLTEPLHDRIYEE